MARNNLATTGDTWRDLTAAQRIALVKPLAGAGQSAGEIVHELAIKGFHTTRSAVCGVCYRAGIGLKGRADKPATKVAKRSGRVASKAVPKFRVSLADRQFRTVASETAAFPDPVVTGLERSALKRQSQRPDGRGVALMDVSQGQCRWPLWGDDGTGDHLVCGATADEAGRHGAYCRPHGALAYLPPKEKGKGKGKVGAKAKAATARASGRAEV